MPGKVLVAMSGGVDSAVACYLIKKAGYDAVGVTMKLYHCAEAGCTTEQDIADAKSVAEKFGIPHFVFDFSDDFNQKVIMPFIETYEKGATPNPCVLCNKNMKFDLLYQKAKELDCDYVATGHYAIVEHTDHGTVLKKAEDLKKDQSYVLYALSQEQLQHTLFPLARMTKEEVREIAASLGFVNAQKKDSQDICFVPDGDYAELIKKTTGREYLPGNFVDVNGNVIAKHKGIIHYTVGQHKGLGIPSDEPYYVKEIQTDNNTIVLCRNEELYEKSVTVDELTWTDKPIFGNTRIQCKIRYRQNAQDALLTFDGNEKATVLFDEPVRAVTPGQSAVFYQGDVVLGGGIIQ